MNILCLYLKRSTYHAVLLLIAFIIHFITLTRLCNLDPSEPHFYIVKLGVSGVYNSSLFYGFLLILNESIF